VSNVEPKVLTTVFCYAGGAEIIRRHLVLWRRHSDHVLLVFPEDSFASFPDVYLFAHGPSQKYGEHCLDRQLAGMRAALAIKADQYVFVEYDAVLFDRPKQRTGIQANTFPTAEPEFASDHFFHFPWIFDRATLEKFVTEAMLRPFEKGFVDRWLAAQGDMIGIPWFDLAAAGEGFSRNTIQTPEEEREALALVENGGYAIHGIKSARLLNQLVAKRDAHLTA